MPVVARFYGIVVKMFFKPKEHDSAHKTDSANGELSVAR